MSEHGNLAEAREALRVQMDAMTLGVLRSAWLNEWQSRTILAALDGHAAALAAARAEGAREAFEKAAKVCEVKVRRDCEYGGRWGGYGDFDGDKTGPECAAAIRALAERGEK